MPSLNSKRRKVTEAVPDQWPFRLLFMAMGLLAIFTGLEAMWHGYWWIHSYKPRLGMIGTGPTLVFVFMGVLFIFLGLIPWRREKDSKSKDDLYKTPEWRLPELTLKKREIFAEFRYNRARLWVKCRVRGGMIVV